VIAHGTNSSGGYKDSKPSLQSETECGLAYQTSGDMNRSFIEKVNY